MDIEEAQRRDRIWRIFFAGVDWDRGEEFALTRQLVLDENNALAPWPYLVDWEWEVVPGASNLGRGDLLFTDGEREYAVVEVKYIDKDSSGPTARTRRKTKRGKAARQAKRLAVALDKRDDVIACLAFVYTNEGEGPTLAA